MTSSSYTSTTVRQNLKRFMRKQGVTQQALALEVARRGRYMHQSAIGKILAGQRRVDVDDLMTFALALHVNPNALLLPNERTGIYLVTGFGAVDAEALWAWAERGVQ